jgi:hypothetical protein
MLKQVQHDIRVCYLPPKRFATYNIEAKVKAIWNKESEPINEANNFRVGLKFLKIKRENLRIIETFVKNNQ